MEYAEEALRVMNDLSEAYIVPLGKMHVSTASYYISGAGAVGLVLCVVVSALLSSRLNPRGKHVIITGGSSGIGLAVAVKYAKMGANVTLVARNMKKLEDAKIRVEKAIGASKNKCHIISLDTSSSQEAVTKALVTTPNPNGDVDILVNCAGTSIAGTFQDTDPGEFSRMFNTNVMGSVYPTRALLPQMKKNKNGSTRIIFVSSQVAQCALHGYTAYASSKWALRGIAEALQMEVKPYNIIVSVAYPPDTDTPGYELEMESKPDLTKSLSETGSVFSSEEVAADIVKYSGLGYFGISTGLDGFFLKQAHPGMSPVNNLWETVLMILLSPLAKIISIFVVLTWDIQCRDAVRKEQAKAKAE
jgi:3-dehydrosphinganine reductase